MKPCLSTSALVFLTACLLLALAGLPQPSTAQTVYRCGADGKVYSDAPCPGGKTVNVADPRTGAQVQAAQTQVQQQQALGQRMQADREHNERLAAAANARASNLGPVAAKPKPEKAAASKQKAKRHPHHLKRQDSEDSQTWRAVVPASRQKKD
jgi:Domain of unknown function (DUF4124)